MLYIFQVDTGNMLTFDMNLAVESISNLQKQIQSLHQIPTSSQVLLVSGGIPLSPDQTVSSCGAGTDTNPIFLFNKQQIEQYSSPSPSSPQLQQQQQGLQNMLSFREDLTLIPNKDPSYSSLIQRSQLGKEIYLYSGEIEERGQVLIHSQHLQHQGWAAVVANLEDIVGVFEKRLREFEECLEKEGDSNSEQIAIAMENLPQLISQLAKLKLPSFLPSSSPLLPNNIESLPAEYRKIKEVMLSKEALDSLHVDSQALLTNTKQTLQNLTEIKGLSSRLYTLDTLHQTTLKTLKEQSDLATSLQTTTNRAHSDPSILIDLYESHKQQLLRMIENMKKIYDICKRCCKAKEELVMNLNSRLKWVIAVQKQINDIMVRLGCVKKLQRRRRGVEGVVCGQLLTTSTTLDSCLTELHRRLLFNNKYNQVLTNLKEKLSIAHANEVKRRREFEIKHSNHFVYSLFPSLSYDLGNNIFEEIVDSSIVTMGSDNGINTIEDVLKELEQEFGTRNEDVEEELEEDLEKKHRQEIKRLEQKYDKVIEELKDEKKKEVEELKRRMRFVEKITSSTPPSTTTAFHKDPLFSDNDDEENKRVIENDDENNRRRNCEIDIVPVAVMDLFKKLKLTPNFCRIGDVVLVYFSVKHEAFLVYLPPPNPPTTSTGTAIATSPTSIQSQPTSSSSSSQGLHFIHTDCQSDMNSDFCYLGNVVDKEYCVAKKNPNRYKLPPGYHFFRVRILLVDKFAL